MASSPAADSAPPSSSPTTSPVLYGRTWPAGWNRLDVELWCFRRKLTVEQGGLGQAQHFKNICAMLWPEFINGRKNPKWFQFHPWADEMLKRACENDFLGVAGCGSSGKTRFFAVWAIVKFLSLPKKTLVLIVSTSLKDSRERIWGAIEDYWLAVKGLPGKLVSSAGRIRYDTGTGEKMSSDLCGISLIAGDQSKAKEAASNLIGKKAPDGDQGELVLIADEAPELAEAINEAALGNLALAKKFQFIQLGNPKSRYDTFGLFIEPKDGWDSIHSEMDGWVTRYGYCIRFDGLKCPNWLAGKNIYPYLIKCEDIKRAQETYGVNSAMFWRMYRGYFCPSGDDSTLWSEADIVKFGGSKSVIWQGEPVPVSALDAGFTNGGDDSAVRFGKWGVEAGTGLHVLLFTELVLLREDVTNKEEPRNFQIAKAWRRACEARGVTEENAAFDSTNIPFADIVAKVWSPKVLRVPFGGKPTERPVSEFTPEPADERYENRVSEVWGAGLEFLKGRQLRGIDVPLARELCERHVETRKKGGLTKLLVESKVDMKARIGRSPDNGDASMVLVDLVRERLRGKVARTRDQGRSPNSVKPWTRTARRFDLYGGQDLMRG